MANPSTVAFTRSSSALFSPAEVHGLMGVEFERARRYGYAVCCLSMRPDRLTEITTVHGEESRKAILSSIIEMVRAGTRAGDLLGYVVEDRILILLPHTRLQEVHYLCDRLLAEVKTIRFEQEDHTTHRITLSIGVSHNQNASAKTFETLDLVAQEGLQVAENSGGDRWAETDLYDLYIPKAPLPSPPSEAIKGPWTDGDYRDRLEDMVAADGDLESAAAALAEEILSRALAETQAAREADDLVREAENRYTTPAVDYEREIEQLRRRVAKLTSSLGVTARELSRLREDGESDDGIASLYRNVQGLTPGDGHGDLRRDLMKSIFQANKDLQVREAG
jgi:diguanylate cyclase (GGDEF)-like protein